MSGARAALLALLLAGPVQAQTPETCLPFTPGCDRLPRLFQDLERDLGPLLDDVQRDLGPMLEGLMRRVDPYLGQLSEMLGDLSGWEAPEVLPNGDILIRRRPAGPPQPDTDAPTGAPFEL